MKLKTNAQTWGMIFFGYITISTQVQDRSAINRSDGVSPKL